MPQSIFISYRRSDSQHAVFAIADRLRWAFGPEEIFMDRSSIESGDDWPESLRRGVEAAKVMIVVIGPSWLTAAGKWGRRRIDDPEDWVRKEVCAGLAQCAAGRTQVVPILLRDAQPVSEEALDAPMQGLAKIQAQMLKDDSWETQLEQLIVGIAERTGMPRMKRDGDRNPNGSPARPERQQSKQAAWTDAQVREALESMSQWYLQWSPHLWGKEGLAQEIFKSYEFASFERAIDFMTRASKVIDTWTPPHHPRWENQWKVLNVSFTTWDVDCRVTKLDIQAAKKLDELYLGALGRGP
jgi:pterin-4a-carbinolamine dehydratase